MLRILQVCTGALFCGLFDIVLFGLLCVSLRCLRLLGVGLVVCFEVFNSV